ncbi:Nucleotide-binding alpha-beta plait [Macrophomina phaseolina MS6]|uniref:Nucleotide-binding alpha-beta plait n=1 Tax=Macrophomina phaseolina (strain MS6) TaxID=1126212 RepID=K2SZJ8_MACPH|nr:Nucleotide-binding alpha-beta plait [Macrophomina phaseolina MS6]
MPDAEAASSDEDAEIPVHESLLAAHGDKSQRKRKRKGDEDDLEDVYMRKLAREEAKEEARRQAERSTKRQKKEDGEAAEDSEEALSDDDGDLDTESESEVPQHEIKASEQKGDPELEKASRTVFVGNVSVKAVSDKSAKKTLVKHMSSFLPELPEHKPPHKFESIRFRSTPFSTYVPKKAAFAKKEILEETTHSTNAYVVYSTQQAAREAARRLNGTIVLERHIRVDEVAHPAKTDHRRCVFVGNLGFVDDESMIQEAESKRIGKEIRKRKEPGDVEEGLWRTFGKVGTVESVRVVRDPKTRVGKGFATRTQLKQLYSTTTKNSRQCFRAASVSCAPRPSSATPPKTTPQHPPALPPPGASTTPRSRPRRGRCRAGLRSCWAKPAPRRSSPPSRTLARGTSPVTGLRRMAAPPTSSRLSSSCSKVTARARSRARPA